MNPKAKQLQARTHRFFVSVVKFCEGMPQNPVTRSIVGQLLDSAGSTDSNYRAACRARSNKEFIAKLGVAAEEADESKGWLEALIDVGIGNWEEAVQLVREADELTAIFVASQNTAKRNSQKRRAEA